MLHRLCGPPSISLSFSLATVLPRRRASCVNLVTAGVNTHYDELSPFTVWTTRVSNPVCYPHFRVSASVTVQVAAFATGVPPDIYGFHPYTGNSATLSGTLAWQFRMQFRGWASGFHIRLAKPPTLALRPINPNNACTLRITAAAGTELAGASFGGTVKRTDYLPARILPSRQKFTTLGPSSFTRRCWVRLSPIAQYSRLLPPVGVWTVSQFQCD